MSSISDAPAASSFPGPALDNKRVAAGAIDLAVLFVVGFAVGTLGGRWTPATSAVAMAWSLYYYFGLEALTGQTLGKRVMGLKVASAGGGDADMQAIAIRTALRLVDGVGLYLVGLIVMLVTGDRRQRIGDLAAGTVVTAVGSEAAESGQEAEKSPVPTQAKPAQSATPLQKQDVQRAATPSAPVPAAAPPRPAIDPRPTAKPAAQERPPAPAATQPDPAPTQPDPAPTQPDPAPREPTPPKPQSPATAPGPAPVKAEPPAPKLQPNSPPTPQPKEPAPGKRPAESRPVPVPPARSAPRKEPGIRLSPDPEPRPAKPIEAAPDVERRVASSQPSPEAAPEQAGADSAETPENGEGKPRMQIVSPIDLIMGEDEEKDGGSSPANGDSSPGDSAA